MKVKDSDFTITIINVVGGDTGSYVSTPAMLRIHSQIKPFQRQQDQLAILVLPVVDPILLKHIFGTVYVYTFLLHTYI